MEDYQAQYREYQYEAKAAGMIPMTYTAFVDWRKRVEDFIKSQKL